MDPADLRHQRILDLLASTGYESVEELSKSLGVSTMTVRRDLDLLEERGQIRRIHGGAVGDAIALLSIDLRVRQRQNPDAKARIARAVCERVQ
ncbi:MAG: DeoR/GlpR transcriptional regulator, partial [Planctomycetes bacterium]|nr:DeoR/GlpR transcriptional regulator [Planctomycetota bacterium]